MIERLRRELARCPERTLYLQAAQDVRVGGRSSAAQYQFTMRGDNLQDLIEFGRPMLLTQMRHDPSIARRQHRSAESTGCRRL